MAEISPGRATARRASRENTLTRTARSGLSLFLRELEPPMLRSSVMWYWTERVTLPVVSQAASWMSIEDDLFLARMRHRISGSPVPNEAYDAASQMLRAALDQGWSKEETQAAVRRALSPNTGRIDPEDLLPKGIPWGSTVERIAATEATAVHGMVTLREMAEEGFTHKRWVAHHDDRTRPSHRATDGVVLPLVQDFQVGNSMMLVPADPRGAIEETASCRCVLVGVR